MIRTRLPESAIRLAAGVAAEPAEHLRMDDAQPRAGEHGDRQLGDHRHVQRHPVAGLQPGEVAQQRGELVHLPEQLRVADVHGLVGLELGHEDDRGLVRIGRSVPVDAIVRGVQPAADKPLAERRGAGVQRRVPGLVPGQQIGVFLEAVGELVLGEPLQDGRVRWRWPAGRTPAAAGRTPPRASALRSVPRNPRIFRCFGGLPLNIVGHCVSPSAFLATSSIVVMPARIFSVACSLIDFIPAAVASARTWSEFGRWRIARRIFSSTGISSNTPICDSHDFHIDHSRLACITALSLLDPAGRARPVLRVRVRRPFCTVGTAI